MSSPVTWSLHFPLHNLLITKALGGPGCPARPVCQALFVNHFLPFLIDNFFCRSFVIDKLICQSIRPFNDRQRGQLFWRIALFSWGIVTDYFLFTHDFPDEKFVDFKKFFWAVNNLSLTRAKSLPCNDLRRRGGCRANSPKVKLFLKNFMVQSTMWKIPSNCHAG